MNSNTTNTTTLDYVAFFVIAVPLVLFFGVVGVGGMIDQCKMETKNSEALTQTTK